LLAVIKEICRMKTLKLTTNGIVNPKKDKPITRETIRANIGFLGIKGKSLLKALMEEKKIEREL
jgi:hypothetical protein